MYCQLLLILSLTATAVLATVPDCSQNGYIPDMDNCIKYYHCFNGVVEEHLTCDKATRKLLYIKQ